MGSGVDYEGHVNDTRLTEPKRVKPLQIYGKRYVMSERVRKVQVLKHPNGRSKNWYLRWWELQPPGAGKKWKERWKSTGTSLKRKAEGYRRELERELEAGRRVNGEMLWQDLTAEFIRSKLSRNPLPTVNAYRSCFRAFTETSAPGQVGDIDVGMLEDFANARLAAPRRPATVNKELRHIRAVLRWAVRRQYLDTCPSFTGVFVREDKPTPVTVPDSTFLCMLKALEDPSLKLAIRSTGWWRAFLYLAYYTGARRGELLGLTWDRVSIERLQITIVSTTSKGRKSRVVPIAADLAAVLTDWRERGEAAQEVLPWPHTTYRQLYNDWHAIQDMVGPLQDQHIVPKNLRSACASELAGAGVQMAVVRDFLGHADISTTANYYVNPASSMRSAADARTVRTLNDSTETVSQTKM